MKKKILVISHDFVKKVNIKVYEELQKNKKNIKILCLRPKKLYINKKHIKSDFNQKDCNVKILETKILFNNLRLLYFKNISQIIKKFKPSEVIIHNDPISLQVIILAILSFINNYSIYCMSNENKIISYTKKLYIQKIPRIILLLILNFFVKYKIKNIFCISKQIKKNYDFLGYKKKTILMPLGYDKKIFKRKNNKNKIFTISYFGRISPEKGIHILIKALEKVEFKFNFFLDTGHIEDKNYFKEILKKLKKILPSSYISLINCNHFEIANFMSKSDLVVLPSIYEEQYGRVIQESVACGSLVIGSRVGAIPEIIKDNDLLFEKNNYRQLATKINLLKNRNFYKNKINKIYKIITKERSLDKQLYILKNLF